MSAELLDKQYPAVELAYPIAVASYEVATKRLDTIDARLQTIMAFAITVSAAIPPLAAARGARFGSFWFYLAVSMFIAAVSCGMYARLAGKVRLLYPDLLFDQWLHKETWEFKKDFIAFAGDDFQFNMNLVEKRWKLTVAITLFFCLEAVFLAAWAAGNA